MNYFQSVPPSLSLDQDVLDVFPASYPPTTDVSYTDTNFRYHVPTKDVSNIEET